MPVGANQECHRGRVVKNPALWPTRPVRKKRRHEAETHTPATACVRRGRWPNQARSPRAHKLHTTYGGTCPNADLPALSHFQIGLARSPSPGRPSSTTQHSTPQQGPACAVLSPPPPKHRIPPTNPSLGPHHRKNNQSCVPWRPRAKHAPGPASSQGKTSRRVIVTIGRPTNKSLVPLHPVSNTVLLSLDLS